MDPLLHLLTFKDALHLYFFVNLIFYSKIVEVVPKLLIEPLKVHSLCCLNELFDVLGEKGCDT